MNTHTISKEELYENFVTKDYLREEVLKINNKLDGMMLDFRSLVLEIANMLNGKIVNTDERLDQHIVQNAVDHGAFLKKA